jgi:hypothetical protein
MLKILSVDLMTPDQGVPEAMSHVRRRGGRRRYGRAGAARLHARPPRWPTAIYAPSLANTKGELL